MAEHTAAPLEGKKDDSGKLRYDLLPPDGVAAITAVLTYGAAKYAPKNWEKGMAWSRLDAALARHMAAFKAGEEHDPETGLPHLAHAACCSLFLLCHQLRAIGTDDVRNADLNVDFEQDVREAVAKLSPLATVLDEPGVRDIIRRGGVPPLSTQELIADYRGRGGLMP